MFSRRIRDERRNSGTGVAGGTGSGIDSTAGDVGCAIKREHGADGVSDGNGGAVASLDGDVVVTGGATSMLSAGV